MSVNWPCVTTVEDKMTKGPQLVQLKYFIPLACLEVVRNCAERWRHCPGSCTRVWWHNGGAEPCHQAGALLIASVPQWYDFHKSTTFAKAIHLLSWKNYSRIFFQHHQPKRNCQTEKLQNLNGTFIKSSRDIVFSPTCQSIVYRDFRCARYARDGHRPQPCHHSS